MRDATRMPGGIEAGEPHAAEQLLPLVYDALRRLAAARLAREAPGQTLQATALVHEAYLRLVGPGAAGRHWDGRAHFFAAAAEAMRRILVENARRRRAAKRGGGGRREDIATVEIADPGGTADPAELLALDEALTRLAAKDPAKAELVKLRYFAGLSLPEIAALQGISLATAERAWAFCRAWLKVEIRGRSARPEEKP
jgi:RNA polymerase sigma factor (TIGR02999 family)